jgi:murein DD-endopeptidase MepM/ murein hydrolase activator NlpD
MNVVKQGKLAPDYEVVMTKKMSLIPSEAKTGQIDLEKVVAKPEVYAIPALEGFTVMINGKETGFFADEAEAQAVIDKLVNKFTAGREVTETYFKETVEVAASRRTAGKFKSYSDVEQAVEYVSKGTDQEKIHVVTEGENFWTISQKYQISIENLTLANPGITPEKLQIGSKVSLLVPVSLVTVCSVEKATYQENIPFETVYKEDATTYKGVNKTTASGSNGKREVVANIIRENGVEIKREVLSEKVIAEPATKVVVKGTKKRPATVGSGVLARPVSRGSITSPFGTRWGRRHTGVDIGVSTGTPVKAADGGKVIFAGYDGAYGYTVRIDHGDNVVTVYAHNSKLQVRQGDRVFKGEQIALSGSTGRSTGPHVHFEVRVNGVPMNPTRYVNF